MSRSLRLDYPQAWHHVMNRGARKQPIFLSDQDRFGFLRRLATASERFGLRVNAMALMGNHYHLLVQSLDAQLSAGMQYLDGCHAQDFNVRNNVDGPLFKGRFRSKLVDSESYLETVLRYVHRNPLEAKLVEQLEDYPWSSYPMFMGLQGRLPPWLSDDALGLVGLRDPVALEAATLTKLPSSSIEELTGPGAIIGSAVFIETALSKAEITDATIAHARMSLPRVRIEVLDRVVEQILGTPTVLPSGRRDAWSVHVRVLSAGLAQRLCRVSLREIADRYGFASPSAAGNAVAKFRRLEHQPGVASEIQRVIEQCERQGDK